MSCIFGLISWIYGLLYGFVLVFFLFQLSLFPIFLFSLSQASYLHNRLRLNIFILYFLAPFKIFLTQILDYPSSANHLSYRILNVMLLLAAHVHMTMLSVIQCCAFINVCSVRDGLAMFRPSSRVVASNLSENKLFSYSLRIAFTTYHRCMLLIGTIDSHSVILVGQ